jgi:two-component system sensor histidine kinase YesM
VLLFDDIESAVFVGTDGSIYFSEDGIRNKRFRILESEHFAELKKRTGTRMMMYIDDEGAMSCDGVQVIVLARRVTRITTGKTLGYLFVNISQNYLMKSYDSEISDYLLFDENGKFVNASLASREETESAKLDRVLRRKPELREALFGKDEDDTVRVLGSTYLVSRKTVGDTGWLMVGLTNTNRFNVTKGQLVLILFVIALIVFVLSGFSRYITRKNVTGPIQKLRDGAQKIAAGDLSVRFPVTSEDEIGDFARTFNYMAEQNEQLVDRIHKESQKKREYELALIQEQVKPHFLYNTLDIIIMLIEMKRSREAVRVTRKLADYYKNTLSGAEEVVMLSREKQIIIDYLDLQLMRYGDKFRYEVDIPEELDNVPIPKMTLQPLVENAIYHGIKQREGWGSIRISGYRKDDGSVVLVLADNGVGMKEEQLQALKEQITRQPEEISRVKMGTYNNRKHFGVYSVYHRLKLYFGDSYGLDIESGYQIGTRILIHIPFGDEEKTEERQK